MKKIKVIYKAELIRYNLREAHKNFIKEFDEYPKESDLLIFLIECNKDDECKEFFTEIKVNKIHRVINIIDL